MKKLALVALVLAACGGGEKKNNVVLPDAPDNTPDAPSGACSVTASLGTVTPANVGGLHDMAMNETTPSFYLLETLLNQDAAPDVLQLQFYKGFAAFDPEFPTAATTIQIAGPETNFQTCGACVLVLPDVNTADGQPGDTPYLATAGSLQLEPLSTTLIQGTLSNVTLTHVTIDPETDVSTPAADGCTASLGSITFMADPEPAPQQKRDGTSPPLRLRNVRVVSVER